MFAGASLGKSNCRWIGDDADSGYVQFALTKQAMENTDASFRAIALNILQSDFGWAGSASTVLDNVTSDRCANVPAAMKTVCYAQDSKPEASAAFAPVATADTNIVVYTINENGNTSSLSRVPANSTQGQAILGMGQ